MVGIVVVSHSRLLARAAVALAEEMLHGGQVRIVVAAGLDDTTFGTDATQIHDAVVAADQGDGVVVLMDLGSAVLSAELALDLLDDAQRGRVVLCPAPLVEGLVVAAVSAATGAGRDEVAAEALAALTGKQEHLAASPPDAPTASPPGGEHTITFTVTAPHGLHARPAARLVQLVREFDAEVQLRNVTTGSGWVPASSLTRVATLGAREGNAVEAAAGGRQAREALDALTALAARHFDDAPLPAPAGEGAAGEPAIVSGPIPVSAGIGIGPVRRMHAPSRTMVDLDVADGTADDPAVEWQRLQAAVTAARADVGAVRERVAREVGAAEAAIFDAHLAILDDPDLLSETRHRVAEGRAAEPAWAESIRQAAEAFGALSDPYLRARADDVRAVGGQVLGHLRGVPPSADPADGERMVLVAADLTPAAAATLDPQTVAAVVLAEGSPTAHSAILVRARGIPAVVGAGGAILGVAEGTLLAVDGGTGEVAVDPDDDVLQDFRARAEASTRRRGEALRRANDAAVTRDGVQVLVGANLGSLDDARAAAICGADVAGLVRTEFLFLGRSHAPDVDEQEAAYRALAEAMSGARLTLRTLDVGGDKPLEYLPMPAEANPFLGVRGVRLSLARPQLLADQLLAMVRVAHDVPLSVMFPMVSTVEEVALARRALDDAIKQTGLGEPAGLQVGIMVEVPAVALKTATVAPLVDFLSIGTNDLTQYALAAERGNEAVSRLGDPLDPGVLRLVDAVCRGAGDTLVAVCGEVAADERAAALLVGLGVRELSVVPHAVPTVKDAVRRLSATDSAALAAAALEAPSAAAVRALLEGPA